MKVFSLPTKKLANTIPPPNSSAFVGFGYEPFDSGYNAC